MRKYKFKAITDGSEFEDYVIKLYEKEEKRLLDVFLHNPDNDIYWAKEINGEIFYSIDEIFNTERQDATHLVIFMK